MEDPLWSISYLSTKPGDEVETPHDVLASLSYGNRVEGAETLR